MKILTIKFTILSVIAFIGFTELSQAEQKFTFTKFEKHILNNHEDLHSMLTTTFDFDEKSVGYDHVMEDGPPHILKTVHFSAASKKTPEEKYMITFHTTGLKLTHVLNWSSVQITGLQLSPLQIKPEAP